MVMFIQFIQSREGRLGLLVTIGSKYLPLSPTIDTAVVGQCSCSTAIKKNSKLSSLELPTPDWAETAAAVRRHFPAGFEHCSGVWFRVESTQCSAVGDEEYKAHLVKCLDTLLKNTNLKVCKCVTVQPFTNLKLVRKFSPTVSISQAFP